MMLFDKSSLSATLFVCWKLLLLSEAMPYGGMMPSPPVVDTSPWMPIAKPNYMSYESSRSYEAPYGSRVVPLQTAFVSAHSPVVTPENIIFTMPETPTSASWIPPTPPASEAPAAGLWVQPNPTPEAPAAGLWAPPNPTPEAAGTIPPVSHEWASTGPLPVVPYWMRSSSNSAMPPSLPVAEPAIEVPANEFPQLEDPWALSQPSPPPPQGQNDHVETNVILRPVQDSISPVAEGQPQDNWPETPRVVVEADKLPALPPATFGQFAVQPAR
ncbi:vegetative cell wall protein gp1 isoform X3 [Daphnia magna]|uniref:vegetative cell wall protein gp1 isoform X2 n=1 Tax=Daphnia magna TaxID=35525 RepID=UPI001E1BAA51|nr:vegetative cell wall protein gp1 isoform X2 [Daphnia magna]XP_045035141.1 vegetative cell wall protein gp1 isoform X3 [Daphnia magna]